MLLKVINITESYFLDKLFKISILIKIKESLTLLELLCSIVRYGKIESELWFGLANRRPN
jgi:hypothetical protein